MMLVVHTNIPSGSKTTATGRVRTGSTLTKMPVMCHVTLNASLEGMVHTLSGDLVVARRLRRGRTSRRFLGRTKFRRRQAVVVLMRLVFTVKFPGRLKMAIVRDRAGNMTTMKLITCFNMCTMSLAGKDLTMDGDLAVSCQLQGGRNLGRTTFRQQWVMVVRIILAIVRSIPIRSKMMTTGTVHTGSTMTMMAMVCHKAWSMSLAGMDRTMNKDLVLCHQL
mmetsp:Transcript_18430/g.34197  ORF Transcript_18430/g.34197 Transcript_18430/m.34197 type:complete len:221 (+) Transcript_18430:1416-2078(+)